LTPYTLIKKILLCFDLPYPPYINCDIAIPGDKPPKDYKLQITNPRLRH